MKIARPKVTTLAATEVLNDVYNWEATRMLYMPVDKGSTGQEDLIEFAGRACYQSFHKPNPATRDNADYIRHIIKQGHHSVLEHASATFYIEGVSRAFTHELIRHRHLSFSQLSQRFVDESEVAIVIPPAIRDMDETHKVPGASIFDAVTMKETLESLLEETGECCAEDYGCLVGRLSETGLPRKQVREAARAVLPNMVETKIVVTGNMRAWRDMLWKRLDPAADAEIREVSGMILDELLKIAPTVFEDIDNYRKENNNEDA